MRRFITRCGQEGEEEEASDHQPITVGGMCASWGLVGEDKTGQATRGARASERRPSESGDVTAPSPFSSVFDYQQMVGSSITGS
ncbi:unnamed protein product [Caenorhabditis auriculariae]|uniref:Uncharacterized protein n=1 Tax=Caenorhabditis auriculariae TaxID=2777116 RepID=A0A8S1HPT7_9PELO|nr:unnamed protein product [Caenorhabditis auriculariae]